MMNVKSPGPPRLTRAEAKARTRVRLLEAGEQVFAAAGFHAATVEQIAEAAGFTRGAFYANFDDKADLLLTLLDDRRRDNLSLLAQRMNRQPEQHGLAALVGWFGQTFAAPSSLDLAMAEFAPLAARDPAYTARLREQLRRVREQVTAFVEEGCARAGFELPIPAARFATMSVALVDGLANLHRLDPDSAPADLVGESLLLLGEGLARKQ
jgi:AcrR family transcriptional regulator